MNKIVAVTVAAAVPVSSPSMANSSARQDDVLIAASDGLIAVDEALDRMHTEHAASGAKGDADEHPDYQELLTARDEHIAALIAVSASSAAGVQARPRYSSGGR